MTDEPVASAKPIADHVPGTTFTVCRVDAQDEDAIRLKRLGICVGRQVQLVQTGDPLIIRVVGCRVGVSRRLAKSVFVTSDGQFRS